MRIDWDARSIHCSVGELIEEITPRCPGFERGEGFRRMWIGQQIHTERADERAGADPFYKAEVAVRHQTRSGSWEIEISGRIDGLSIDRERRIAVVEEVKSIHFARELLGLKRSDKLQRYLFQLMLYSWFLAHQEELADYLFVPQLVLVDLVSGRNEIIDAPYDADDVRQGFESAVGALVERIENEAALVAAKRAFAEGLVFPHPELRPFQREMIEAVERAVRQQEALLVSAPTGVGKTVAAVYPALREALRLGKKLFYLTSKTLQQEIAVSTLTAVNDGSFRVLRIRAKQKMCAHTEVICHEDFCPFAARYGEKMQSHAVISRITDSMSYFDPDQIFDLARTAEVCPFEVSLELIEQADVVVCDYNYIFDPWVGLSSYRGENDYGGCVLIIDEAHNLADRARGYFSPRIDEALLRNVEMHLASRPACELWGAWDLLDEMRTHLVDLGSILEEREPAGEPGEPPPSRDLPRQALCEPDRELIARHRRAWEKLVLRYIDWKIENRIAEESDPLVDFYFRLVRFSDLLQQEGDELARIIEKTPDGLRLKIFCMDASRHLGSILDSAHATIAISATLEPFDFYRQVLGFPPSRTTELSLPSPFPAANRKILVIPEVETTWKKRGQHAARISELLGTMADAAEGNFLALFPSYVFLEEVGARLPTLSKQVAVQRTDMTDWERRSLLERLRENSVPGTLLLAVSGGMYAEGVDYKGEMLSGVFVVGPALPTVSFEQELLRDYYEQMHGAGFEYAYLIPGMTRVIQSAGRVIRSESDVGVIALLCKRFTWNTYNRYFPAHWYEESPRELVSRNPAMEIRQFFERKRALNLSLF
ncbi:MAG TPA: ATP-dependent DNA helicase [Thermoanaerobaculia bacterium]|nr:ATP-dependent DNA helicase [Thermoanaerobaculia bacterium]